MVENEFTTGDIYAFYEFERDADGRVVTQDGNHSTYSTDIKGKALGIANRKDNIYQIADLSASTTTEVKLSGKQQLELLVEAGELTQAQVDEIKAIEDEKKRNKAKGDIIRSVAGRLRGQGKTYLADRLTAKSGYVSAEKAGDKSLKRIVSDAGTSYDGKTLLESLIVGQTLDGRMNVLQEAATQLTEEGNAKVREFKNKEGNFEMLSLPVGMYWNVPLRLRVYPSRICRSLLTPRLSVRRESSSNRQSSQALHSVSYSEKRRLISSPRYVLRV